MPRTIARLILCAVVGSVGATPIGAQSRDTVIVKAIHPPGPLHRGVPAEITLDVDVVLNSMDGGEVATGFNIQDPKRYVMLASARVRRGWQHVTLTWSPFARYCDRSGSHRRRALTRPWSYRKREDLAAYMY